MPFLDLWRMHPRDVERLTVPEFDLLRKVADKRIDEARRNARR